MKFLTAILLALVLTMVTSCAGLQTQHQKIGAACETAATALDALTAAKLAGKVSKEQLQDAIRVYRPTTAFCQPVAEKLSDVDYEVLIDAAATLSAKQSEVQ